VIVVRYPNVINSTEKLSNFLKINLKKESFDVKMYRSHGKKRIDFFIVIVVLGILNKRAYSVFRNLNKIKNTS
jgi:hypothetical protein